MRLARGPEFEGGRKSGWLAVVRSSSGRRGGKPGLPLGVGVVSPVTAEALVPCFSSLTAAAPNAASGDPGPEPDPVPLGDRSTIVSPQTTIDSSTPISTSVATLMLIPSSTRMLSPTLSPISWSWSPAVDCTPLGVCWSSSLFAVSFVCSLSAGRVGSFFTDIIS